MVRRRELRARAHPQSHRKDCEWFQTGYATFQGIVSEEQLNALAAHVKSLSQPATGTAGFNNGARALPRPTPEYAGAIVMVSKAASTAIPANQAPKLNYLNNGAQLQVLPLTTDHKRIAVLYLSRLLSSSSSAASLPCSSGSSQMNTGRVT